MVYRLKHQQEIFQMIRPFLRANAPKATKLSCVGFCFGGWVVGRILGCLDAGATSSTTNNNDKDDGHDASSSNSNLTFQRGVGIHPAFSLNLLHGESAVTMAERIHKPMLLLPG